MNENFDTPIVSIITFRDGSRLVVKVEVPTDCRMDTATIAYYGLCDKLELISKLAEKGGDAIENTR